VPNYYVDTGLIAQNVYLASSALGLALWFHNCKVCNRIEFDFAEFKIKLLLAR